MIFNTYAGWNNAGYYILKGEKSRLRDPDTDEPLFSENQVEEKKTSYKNNSFDPDSDDDDYNTWEPWDYDYHNEDWDAECY